MPATTRPRQALRQKLARPAAARAPYSRQTTEADPFAGMAPVSGAPALLEPPYAPSRMYELYEESGVLRACVDAYVRNIDGFGHELVPAAAGMDEAFEAEAARLAELFERPNPEESFGDIRRKLRRDYEVCGNAYLEVVRDAGGLPSLLFHADATRMRLARLDQEPTTIAATVPRGGVPAPVAMEKRFRRLAMAAPGAAGAVEHGGKQLRYFKEYGDPRPLDALTGRYQGHGGEDGDPVLPATEVIHFKNGHGPYGAPRWIGTLLSAMGAARAEFVNYDLFDSQGIPPMLVLLSGGQLTDESLEDLVRLMDNAKGAKNFHKTLILEAEATGGALGAQPTPQLEVKNLADYRKEDAMFLNYLKDAREAVRKFGFRLPGLFLGQTEDHNYATAKVARTTAEEQVFAPERRAFDERLNATVVRDLGVTAARFKSLGPPQASSEDILRVLPLALESGGLDAKGLAAVLRGHFGLDPAAREGS